MGGHLRYCLITFASLPCKLTPRKGPLVSASAFGTHIVSVNSVKKANEILERKNAVYSSRPHVPMAVDLMGWKDSLAFLPYGSRLKLYRKTFHEELGNPSALKLCWSQEETHARRFLQLCLHCPNKLLDHCFQYADVLLRYSIAENLRVQDTLVPSSFVWRTDTQ